MAQYINTKQKLKTSIDMSSKVYIQVRFGVSEKWCRITKIEAHALAETLPEDSNPQDCEMYSGSFGTMEADDELFLG